MSTCFLSRACCKIMVRCCLLRKPEGKGSPAPRGGTPSSSQKVIIDSDRYKRLGGTVCATLVQADYDSKCPGGNCMPYIGKEIQCPAQRRSFFCCLQIAVSAQGSRRLKCYPSEMVYPSSCRPLFGVRWWLWRFTRLQSPVYVLCVNVPPRFIFSSFTAYEQRSVP